MSTDVCGVSGRACPETPHPGSRRKSTARIRTRHRSVLAQCISVPAQCILATQSKRTRSGDQQSRATDSRDHHTGRSCGLTCPGLEHQSVVVGQGTNVPCGSS